VYERSRARALFIGLVVTAVILVTIDARDIDRTDGQGLIDRARSVATAVVRPLQDGVTAAVRPFGTLSTTVSDLVATRAQNRSLREEVAALSERRRSVADLERENAELKALLAMRDRGGHRTVAARTVALAPSTFEWTITIDVGSDDGVARGMPVINGDGLVGRVLQVTPRASRVLLVTDPTFSVAARSASDGVVGVLDGRGGEPMSLRPLDPRAELAVGDEIVTASYEGGGFPSGIPIGVVDEVGEERSRLEREYRLRPFVDFARLGIVLVVLSSPVEEVPSLDGSVGLPYTRPPVPPIVDPDDVEVPDPTTSAPTGQGAP
jgi:rod shape-determining protein MreC